MEQLHMFLSCVKIFKWSTLLGSLNFFFLQEPESIFGGLGTTVGICHLPQYFTSIKPNAKYFWDSSNCLSVGQTYPATRDSPLLISHQHTVWYSYSLLGQSEKWPRYLYNFLRGSVAATPHMFAASQAPEQFAGGACWVLPQQQRCQGYWDTHSDGVLWPGLLRHNMCRMG